MRFVCTVSIFILLLTLTLSAPGTGYAQDKDHQALADDLVLPMPEGRSMLFRAVCIGAGDGMYAWKRFRIGDPSGGYKESPTGVALGGAFNIEKKEGTGDWCYYVGKYEVTEDQLFAVLHNNPRFEHSTYPARNLSWFEAQDFIRRYNDWLYTNALQKIPKYGGVPGYLRLPTESEWEFAARGGSLVDSGRFDRKTPYPAGKLADYEWFSGPTSSHNKVKKTGLLKANPLGLHDMLGNVAEMTRSLYRVEYYQGRSGGFVAKGGHYLTDGKKVRSSLRTEQEFYAFDRRTKKLRPGKKNTLGFRLVLSSLVFPNRQISRKMKEDWDSYRLGMARSLPAAISTGSTSAKTRVSATDITTYLDRLKKELTRSGGISENVRQELDLLTSSLDEIQFTIRQAEKDSAYAWIKIAAEQAFFIVREARKLPILHKLQDSARKSQRTAILKKFTARENEIQQNIDQTMSSYAESIRQLGSTGDAAVTDGIRRYRQFLTDRRAQQQILLLPTVQQHTKTYLQVKRTNDEQWKKELMQWHPAPAKK